MSFHCNLYPLKRLLATLPLPVPVGRDMGKLRTVLRPQLGVRCKERVRISG